METDLELANHYPPSLVIQSVSYNQSSPPSYPQLALALASSSLHSPRPTDHPFTSPLAGQELQLPVVGWGQEYHHTANVPTDVQYTSCCELI